jgi:tellurite resistance protein
MKISYSWAAGSTTGSHWTNAKIPTAQRIYGWFVLAAITVFIGGIRLRTAVATARGQLLPP